MIVAPSNAMIDIYLYLYLFIHGELAHVSKQESNGACGRGILTSKESGGTQAEFASKLRMLELSNSS